MGRGEGWVEGKDELRKRMQRSEGLAKIPYLSELFKI